jgi:hypothetical protein
MHVIRGEKKSERAAFVAAAITVVVALLPFALRRRRAHPEAQKKDEPVPETKVDPVDEASMESFPASDPPSTW